MTTPILDTLYRWSNRLRQWISVETLRPVAVNLVIREVHQQQSNPQNLLRNLTTQLYSGSITIGQWQIASAQMLKDAHLAEAMFAVGGKANLNAATLARLRDTLRKEFGFLDQFAKDIVSGDVSEGQALARINQYANAVQQSYWHEYKLLSEVIYWNLNPAEHCADCLDLAGRSPYQPQDLSQVPGDGNTTCRGNCKCTLSREVVEQTVITETSEQGTE
jgi:hypothetical protein